MIIFLHQLLLLFLGFCPSFFFDFSVQSIIACLCAIITATMTYVFIHHKAVISISIGYVILSCFFLPFISYLPLISYPFAHKRQPFYLYAAYSISILCTYRTSYLPYYIYVSIVMFFAYWLKQYAIENETMQLNHIIQRDTSKELSLVLADKNQELLIQQNQKIQIATLHERNRIAREIHDNIGHLLSSSLLQLGAIQATCADDTLTEPLQNLIDTLSEGMDHVRKSVHDLHDDTIMLESSLRKTIEQFHFSSIDFEYDIKHPLSQTTSYQILAIVKESLTNIMKHSNGTKVLLILREHPAFYQLVVYDNGTKKKMQQENGIGLIGMQERVDNLNGYMNIDNSHGFQIFITLPKEEITNENTHCR